MAETLKVPTRSHVCDSYDWRSCAVLWLAIQCAFTVGWAVCGSQNVYIYLK